MMKLHKIFICNFWCLEGKCFQNKDYLSSYNDDNVFMLEGNEVETWKMQYIESLLSLYVSILCPWLLFCPGGGGHFKSV